MNTEQNGQRAVGLDLLKALAIILVVFLHNAQLNPGSVIDNAFMMLCTSAVPVFFMVTGAIQLNRTGSINYRRHLMSIGRLYALVICWKVLYAAFMHFFYAVPIDGSLSNLVNYIFLFQEIPGVSTGHFWYFQALIALYIILPQ
ncbi:acyltransferase family protein [Stomatobaculum longum]